MKRKKVALYAVQVEVHNCDYINKLKFTYWYFYLTFILPCQAMNCRETQNNGKAYCHIRAIKRKGLCFHRYLLCESLFLSKIKSKL